jgi:hypothetical protein
MPTRFLNFNWMRGVADDKRLSILYRTILMRICLHRYNDTGNCDPGYNAIAAEVGVHRTTVIRAVETGVRFGWLAPPLRGRRANASFVFTFPDQEVAPGATSKPDQEVAAGEQHQENQEVALGDLRSRSGTRKKSLKKRASRAKSKSSAQHGRLSGRQERETQNICEPPDFASRDSGSDTSAKPVRKKRAPKASAAHGDIITMSDLAAAFAEFWAAYPKRVAKAAAEKAFAAAIKRGADPAALIEGAKRYASERTGQDQKFTKHPATWLNAECWLDEPSTGTGPPTIDEHGNVIPEPQPQRSRPQSIDEAADAVRSEYPDGNFGGRR